ncbi:MAG: FISUMP domain-containing protein [Bacteroidota bacterium]
MKKKETRIYGACRVLIFGLLVLLSGNCSKEVESLPSPASDLEGNYYSTDEWSDDDITLFFGTGKEGILYYEEYFWKTFDYENIINKVKLNFHEPGFFLHNISGFFDSEGNMEFECYDYDHINYYDKNTNFTPDAGWMYRWGEEFKNLNQIPSSWYMVPEDNVFFDENDHNVKLWDGNSENPTTLFTAAHSLTKGVDYKIIYYIYNERNQVNITVSSSQSSFGKIAEISTNEHLGYTEDCGFYTCDHRGEPLELTFTPPSSADYYFGIGSYNGYTVYVDKIMLLEEYNPYGSINDPNDPGNGSSEITVTDADGNEYETVTIGNQTWMAENLRTTTFNNGDPIPTTNPPALDLRNESEPKYQWAYDGNDKNTDTYGRLYTWYTIMDDRGVCPSGYHLPEENEWDELIEYLGGEEIAGDKLKESGQTHWIENIPTANNESGFAALPGGARHFSKFDYSGYSGYYWSGTECTDYTNNAINYYMQSESSMIGKSYWWQKKIGLSVRCIKD